MKSLQTAAATLLTLATVAAGRASAVTVNAALRTTAGFEADGDDSLGQRAGSKASQNVFANFAPRALIQFNPDWTGYVRARLFIPSGNTEPFDSSVPNNISGRTHAFVGLSEFLIQYNGLTSYPGEALSFGRQHIRTVGSEWLDQDVDSLRWVFDTTLRSFDIGLAHQLSTYRSDGVRIPADQRNRTYAFADASFDWRPEHRLGARVLEAIDGGDAPAVGSSVDTGSKLRHSQLTWLGLYADNGFYDVLDDSRIKYWAELNYLIGHSDDAVAGPGNRVTAERNRAVRAYSGTVGTRWTPVAAIPVAIGGLYTYSSGGDGATSHQYEQSGLQSNSSTFAGTQTLINRYNETLSADLGNLRVATGFVTLHLEDDSVTAIFSNFTRNDGNAPISVRRLNTGTVNASTDIGNGLDIVASHYFGRIQRRSRLLTAGDAYISQERRSFVSIRLSAFDPGAAFGQSTKTDYRAFLEATLWVD